jgi:hypothetical protein
LSPAFATSFSVAAAASISAAAIVEIFVTLEVLSTILKVLSNTGDNTNSTKNVTGVVLDTYVADATQ